MMDVSLFTAHFPELDQAQLELLRQLQDLYEFWNAQINVISRKDMEQFYEHHVLHSLALSKVWQPKNKQKVLDIGTGGGFPGIPLAIMFPEVQFTLVDSIGKKIKVVKEVAAALNLQNITALHERAENLQGRFDYVVTRAVARLSKLVEICTQGKFRTTELLCLKGGDLQEELLEIKRYPNMDYSLSNFFKEDFFETKKIVRVYF